MCLPYSTMLRRLDDKERQMRMRLAADKADIQRARAAARADRYRQQLMLQEQGEQFIRARRTTMVIQGVLPPQSDDTQHRREGWDAPWSPHVLRAVESSVAAKAAVGSDPVRTGMTESAAQTRRAADAQAAPEYEDSDLDESYASDFESMDSDMHTTAASLQVGVAALHQQAHASQLRRLRRSCLSIETISQMRGSHLFPLSLWRRYLMW
jgi:hypothetical protein